MENWPQNGEIKFDSVSMKYDTNSSHFALNNLSFNVRPKATVGIVGRTGAGKSSILKSLLRLSEISNGSI